MNAAANGVTVLAVCADVLDQDHLLACGADLVLVADAFYGRDLAGKVVGSWNDAAPAEPLSWLATRPSSICPATG